MLLYPPLPPALARLPRRQYCLRRGQYSATVPDNLNTLPGEPCQKIDGLTCIRTRETIITALDQATLAAFRPAPPAAEPVVEAGGPGLVWGGWSGPLAGAQGGTQRQAGSGTVIASHKMLRFHFIPLLTCLAACRGQGDSR